MNYPLYVSIIMLLALAGGNICMKARLPSVTGFIVVGLVLGPSFTNIINSEIVESMTFVNDLAMGILAISLGAELHWPTLKRYSKDLPPLVIGEIVLTILMVSLLSYLFGLSFQVSIILGVLAITVSPSGIVPVIQEYGGKGPLTQNLLAMVAIDNLIGIVLFGTVLALFEGFAQEAASGFGLILLVLLELMAAILIGIVVGYTLVHFIKKNVGNTQFLVILIGLILLNIGIANQFHLSAMLINMITGLVITNLRNRSMTLSATIERVQLPIIIVYMTLAGARINLGVAAALAVSGGVYIIGRFTGKVLGSYLLSGLTDLSRKVRKNIGLGLIPQAGITVGLSILAEQKIPEAQGVITGIVLTGVVFFQVLGPIMVAKALNNANEVTINK
ncbi:MAG: cation:proton antiporter [Dethiosulfatibacter sp.]|nr:cation:proton antiporter [Dethiosulfatibacter sp.]